MFSTILMIHCGKLMKLWRRYAMFDIELILSNNLRNNDYVCYGEWWWATWRWRWVHFMANSMSTYIFLSRGMVVTLFKGAEYRDSKVRFHCFSVKIWDLWIQLDLDFHLRTESKIQGARNVQEQFLGSSSYCPTNIEHQAFRTIWQWCRSMKMTTADDNAQRNPPSLLISIAQEALKKDHSNHYLELLYLFITHCIMLETISSWRLLSRSQTLTAEFTPL